MSQIKYPLLSAFRVAPDWKLISDKVHINRREAVVCAGRGMRVYRPWMWTSLYIMPVSL